MALDPLDADQVLLLLPEMNKHADTGAIARTLAGLLPSSARLSSLSYQESMAAMRDLGILLGSLRRHEVEPIHAVAGLEPVLLELGRRTDMIPRETVHHYTELNPRDGRQRMYTGRPQETSMMDSVRVSLRRMAAALSLCERLFDLPADEAEFAELLAELADELTAFDASMNLVNEKVPPEFFYDVMRPYFEEIEVGGDRYLGPTAGHVPLFLIDLVLWSSGQGTPEFDEYRRTGVQYTLPHYRACEPQWAAAPSLMARVCDALTALPPDEPIPLPLRESVTSLTAALRVLTIFRGKHVTYARRTYPAEDRAGSGGGTIALLQDILDLTRQNANLVRLSGTV